MPRYRFLFRLSPPCYFGLPDGAKLVLPLKEGGTDIVGPVLDLRTGELVSHGSLPQYRAPSDALSLNMKSGNFAMSFRDNFLEVIANGKAAQETTNQVLAQVDLLTQSLTAMYGDLFSASLMLVEDEAGVSQSVHAGPRVAKLFQASVFNIPELKVRAERAGAWSDVADSAAKKALFYFEHACLLAEFSGTFSLTSPHAAFSRAMAFLQLFKALTAIVGDPSSDKDYQSRCKRLGLGKDFWQTKARPLYDVRNDSDVAHYSHALPEPGAFIGKYGEAVAVFREALEAHMNSLLSSARNG